jgi:solute:Na+ symporter, SSS family
MLDLAIVLLFVAYAIYRGFKSRSEAGQNLQEYFLAGKTLKGWKAGISMSATQFAADTPLLVTGLIATEGIHGLWRLWIYGISFLFLAYVFATKWRESGVITDAELTQVRYSGKGVLPLRVFKAIYYGTIINCVIMAMVLVAATRVSEVFLTWHLWLPAGIFTFLQTMVENFGLNLGTGTDAVITTNNLLSIFFIMAFTTLYSATGGLRSVVATDAMQFGLAMLGTLAYAVFIIIQAGGLGAAVDTIYAQYGEQRAAELLSFSPGATDLLLPFLTIISLQWFFQMNSDGTGYLAQRLMACRSDREASIGAIIFAWTQILFRSLIWLVIGVGILAIYPYSEADITHPGFVASREMLFVSGIREILPIGLTGLILTGLLGALASTLDTHLNWGASYWSNDIYKCLICKHWLKRDPDDRELVWVARGSNLLILGISIIVMFNLGSIQEAWTLSLLFGAGMGAVLFLRWIWERINLFSELAAMVTSLITAPILLMFVEAAWLQLLIMSLVTTVAAVAVTWVTPPTDPAVLKKFYTEVHPQGFWASTAKSVGDDPLGPLRRFAGRVGAVAVTSLSLYLCLIGSGRLLLWSDPQTSLGVSLFYLALGLLLIPLWWKNLDRIFSRHPNIT